MSCIYGRRQWRRNTKGKAVRDNKFVTTAKLVSILANICLSFPTFLNCLSTPSLIDNTLLIHYFFFSRGLYIPTKHVWCMGIACDFCKIQPQRCDVSRAIEHPLLFAASSHLPTLAAWGNPSPTGCSSFVWLFFFPTSLTQCQQAVHVHRFTWLCEVVAQVLKHFTLPAYCHNFFFRHIAL